MKIPSHSAVVWCAILAGVCAVAGFAVATFAMIGTPNVQEILHYENGAVVRRESKWIPLFGPVIFQVIAFGVSAHLILRWDQFSKDAVQATQDFNEQHRQRVDVGWGLRLLVCALVGFEVFALMIVLFNSFRLLNP